MSDKQPPKSPDNDRTLLSQPAPPSEAATRVSTSVPPVTDTNKPTVIADGDDKTRLMRPSKIAAGANTNAGTNTHATTQYTRYNATGPNSTGFEKAQLIAQQTLDNRGTLLKKRFVLEEVLGHGGMGTVYKAKDLRKVEAEDPNPYIATKVLNQDFKDHPDAFVTLQQEAAKSHTLAHPNIVTVHDFDRDGDTLFMTMELLEGKPLDELLKTKGIKGLPKVHALKILRDLCAALAYAHQRHIIHADFKPGNVFVMKDGSAKVLDFGIARAASKESQKHKFDAGQLGALTPAYATIEMINDEPLTFTDDVYALACVAYEILTGQHPYAGRSAYTAKQQGLKPKKVESLSSGEWRALQRALALDKPQRTATVKQFMNEFFPSRGGLALKFAVAVSLLGVGGASWFAYQQYQAEAQIATTITEKLTQAQTCFALSDFACSIDNLRVALNLDANNAIATQLLQNAQLAHRKQLDAEQAAQLTQEAELCIRDSDYACAQIKARELLSLNAEDARAQSLLTRVQDLALTAEIDKLALQADECLKQEDIPCAARLTEQAVALNALHPTTLALQEKLLQTRQQNMQVAEALAQKLANFISKGQACLDSKKYTCAVEQADAALALDSNHGAAISLKQSATLAHQQAREAEAKVKAILAQAKTCLDQQKNYSCAIAKAEAALDIIPNHREAKDIKQKAEQTQRQLKETGFTIR